MKLLLIPLFLLISLPVIAFADSHGEQSSSLGENLVCETDDDPTGTKEVMDTKDPSIKASCHDFNKARICAKEDKPYVENIDRKEQMLKDMDTVNEFMKKYNSTNHVKLPGPRAAQYLRDVEERFPVPGLEDLEKEQTDLIKERNLIPQKNDERYAEGRKNVAMREKLGQQIRQVSQKIKNKKNAYYRRLGVFTDVNYSSGGIKNSELSVDLFTTSPHRSNMSNLYIRSPIHHFLSKGNSNIDPKKYEALKKEVVDNLLRFESEHNCQAEVIATGYNIGIYGDLAKEIRENNSEQVKNSDLCFETEAAAESVMNKYKSQIDEYYKERHQGAGALKTNNFCNVKVTGNEIRAWGSRVIQKPSCSGTFTKHFADNIWSVSKADVADDPKYQEFAACLERMKKQGNKFRDMVVSAASNRLSNGGNAARNFCAKGFGELSQARANAAKDFLAQEFGYTSDQVKTKVIGSGKDGGSGPCPYKLVNGQEVVIKDFLEGGSRRQEMEDNKYVKVVANFDPIREEVKDSFKCFQYTRQCAQLRYKCKHNSDKDYEPGWPKYRTAAGIYEASQ